MLNQNVCRHPHPHLTSHFHDIEGPPVRFVDNQVLSFENEPLSRDRALLEDAAIVGKEINGILWPNKHLYTCII